MFFKKWMLATFFFTFFAVKAQTALGYNIPLSDPIAIGIDAVEFPAYLLNGETAAMEFYRDDYTVETHAMKVDFDSEALANELNALYFKRRSGMEKTGRILTFVGVPLAIIGGIMVAGADELYYNCVNGDCEGDARGGFGVVALAAGLGLSGTGTALWIIGSKR